MGTCDRTVSRRVQTWAALKNTARLSSYPALFPLLWLGISWLLLLPPAGQRLPLAGPTRLSTHSPCLQNGVAPLGWWAALAQPAGHFLLQTSHDGSQLTPGGSSPLAAPLKGPHFPGALTVPNAGSPAVRAPPPGYGDLFTFQHSPLCSAMLHEPGSGCVCQVASEAQV